MGGPVAQLIDVMQQVYFLALFFAALYSTTNGFVRSNSRSSLQFVAPIQLLNPCERAVWSCCQTSRPNLGYPLFVLSKMDAEDFTGWVNWPVHQRRWIALVKN